MHWVKMKNEQLDENNHQNATEDGIIYEIETLQGSKIEFGPDKGGRDGSGTRKPKDYTIVEI